MVIPIDSDKRGLNSFVLNTNKTCTNTMVYGRRRTPKPTYETAYRCHLRVTQGEFSISGLRPYASFCLIFVGSDYVDRKVSLILKCA